MGVAMDIAESRSELITHISKVVNVKSSQFEIVLQLEYSNEV